MHYHDFPLVILSPPPQQQRPQLDFELVTSPTSPVGAWEWEWTRLRSAIRHYHKSGKHKRKSLPYVERTGYIEYPLISLLATKSTHLLDLPSSNPIHAVLLKQQSTLSNAPSLQTLPLEILDEILTHLSLKSWMQLRLLSRHFNQLVTWRIGRALESRLHTRHDLKYFTQWLHHQHAHVHSTNTLTRDGYDVHRLVLAQLKKSAREFVTDEWMHALINGGYLHQVTHVNLRGCTRLTSNCIRELLSCCAGHLKTLIVGESDLVTDYASHLSHQIQLPMLQRVELHHLPKVTDDFLLGISKHAHMLKHLVVRQCKRITGLSLLHLAPHPLCQIEFHQTGKITHVQLEKLSSLSSWRSELKVLDMHGVGKVRKEVIQKVIEKCCVLQYLGIGLDLVWDDTRLGWTRRRVFDSDDLSVISCSKPLLTIVQTDF